MKKAIVYCIALSITVLTSCSSPKKVKTESDSATKENTVQTSTEKNLKNMTQVQLKTSLGDIVIALYDDTPAHKANFEKLVRTNFYDGVLFHRIIKGFMIQGGDPDSKTAKPGQHLGAGDVGYTIPAEFVPAHHHVRGAIAAARRGDAANPLRESSGSQFYIVHDPRTCAQLDGQYTVFGETIEGFEVIDKIASVDTDPRDCPLSPVKIVKIELVK